MKKNILVMVLIFSCASAMAKSWKENISDGFSNAVDYSKDAYTSVKDSVFGDPESEKYLDVRTGEALTQYTELTIMNAVPLDDQRYEINIGVKNLADKPVRLMDLYDDREVLLLDQDGFAYPLAENLVYGEQTQFILIPHEAGIRAKWIFRNVEAKPVKVRVFGKDYPIVAQ